MNTNETSGRWRLHWRIALATGVPFALLWGGYEALIRLRGQAPDPIGVVVFSTVVAAVLFGAVMSAVLGTRQFNASRERWERRRALDPDGPGDFTASVRRCRTVRLDVSPAEAFRRCLHAHRAVHRARVTGADEATGTIIVRVGMSWRSWGERMVLRLTPYGTSGTEVEVSSSPAFSLTVVDYGRNDDNVDEMIGWLRGQPAADART